MKHLPSIVATPSSGFARRWSGHLFLWAGMAMALMHTGCKEEPEVKEYDRAALVANIGTQQIKVAYHNLQLSVGGLYAHYQDFRLSPNLVTLDAFHVKFMETWANWKLCSAFEFGPAASLSLRSILNTFPCDTFQIHSNFMAGTWDLNQATNVDARGFPALDFMLYGLGMDNDRILERYQNPADSSKLMTYLDAIVEDIWSQISTVHQQWDGGYLTTFTQSVGTDVGSSTSLLVNELNRDLEIIKTASLGIPLGKQTFDQPLPEKVEGYYSGYSMLLMKNEVLGLQALFEGQYPNLPEGYGLREALDAVEAQYHEGSLSDTIGAQFEAVIAAIDQVPGLLSYDVVQHRPQVEALYTEIQKLVVLLKADMASALSILITYTDADGD